MLWFYQREQHRLHFEIRHQPDGTDYELVINYPDGRQDIERFTDPDALLERSSGLQHSLSEDGWQPPHVKCRPSLGRS